MQPRRIARELALLSVSQLSNKPEKLAEQDLQDVLIAAIRTLAGEVQDTLEMAAAELKRSNDRLLNSELRAIEVESARAMVNEAIALTQTAINRLGLAMDLPEFIQMTNQPEVREHSLQILQQLQSHRARIDALLETSLVDWQLHRLARWIKISSELPSPKSFTLASPIALPSMKRWNWRNATVERKDIDLLMGCCAG